MAKQPEIVKQLCQSAFDMHYSTCLHYSNDGCTTTLHIFIANQKFSIKFHLEYPEFLPASASVQGNVIGPVRIYTRIMVTIKKRAGVIPYSFSSSIALLSSLLSCSFYLLDPRTISRVDILEMT